MAAADLLTAIRGLAGMISVAGLASAEEVERMLTAATSDLDTPGNRCVLPFSIAYGQRVR